MMHSLLETGSETSVADVSATTVPICAANARDGVMSVISEPTVPITRQPSVRSPATKAHTARRSGHCVERLAAAPLESTALSCISGPAEFDTSWAPWTNATETAERTSSGPKSASTASTSLSCSRAAATLRAARADLCAREPALPTTVCAEGSARIIGCSSVDAELHVATSAGGCIRAHAPSSAASSSSSPSSASSSSPASAPTGGARRPSSSCSDGVGVCPLPPAARAYA
mmetsp:Transcript_18081/g.56333  ORF Transcript_18081/g.56333 Transcript_18081/m.56333 type:complete len:231 (-) Transcript_18081:150-842(-)